LRRLRIGDEAIVILDSFVSDGRPRMRSPDLAAS
jgi:hypothetical protein